MAKKHKLPAYGRDLRQLLAAGQAPRHGVAVFVDRPVERGIFTPLAVFADADPATLDWSLCRGLDVVVPHADQVPHSRLIATIKAVVAADPRRLLLLKKDEPGFEFVVSAGMAAS